MSENSEVANDLKEKASMKRIANRNFGISIVAGLMLLLWYFCNPSEDTHKWPLIVGLAILPASWLFKVHSLAFGNFVRLLHYLLLSSALVPDLVSYLRGDQSTFLGNGIWWPLFWYGIAVFYFTLWAIAVLFGYYVDLTDDSPN
jgi:hypothetical protein